jgi:hypothetical protein
MFYRLLELVLFKAGQNSNRRYPSRRVDPINGVARAYIGIKLVQDRERAFRRPGAGEQETA